MERIEPRAAPAVLVKGGTDGLDGLFLPAGTIHARPFFRAERMSQSVPAGDPSIRNVTLCLWFCQERAMWVPTYDAHEA